MRITHFGNTAITGVACAVPTRVVRTMDNTDFGEHELKRFVKGTGVKERRKAAAGQTASDLCYAAARGLMQERNVDAASIGALVFITQTPDYVTPSTAYALSYRLGLSKDCIAFDVNLGCSAFSYGVHIASSLIASGSADRVLVLIGDVFTWGYENAKDALLFGDCGSAVMFERAEGTAGIDSAAMQDGSNYDAVIVWGGAARHHGEEEKLAMDGMRMVSFTAECAGAAIADFMSKIGKGIKDFDSVLLHQANLAIIKGVSNRLGAKEEQVPVSVDRFGNTLGASIPITIVDMKERRGMKSHERVLASGFGMGLSWGVASFELDADAVLPLIETDEKWSDVHNARSVKQAMGVLSTSLGGGATPPLN